MALLEDQFNKWIKTHDRYDELVAKYNDVFNSNIPYEYNKGGFTTDIIALAYS